MGHVDIAGTSLLLVGTIGAGQGLVGWRGRVLVKREDGKDVDNDVHVVCTKSRGLLPRYVTEV